MLACPCPISLYLFLSKIIKAIIIYYIYLYLKSFSNYNDDELFLSYHLLD